MSTIAGEPKITDGARVSRPAAAAPSSCATAVPVAMALSCNKSLGALGPVGPAGTVSGRTPVAGGAEGGSRNCRGAPGTTWCRRTPRQATPLPTPRRGSGRRPAPALRRRRGGSRSRAPRRGSRCAPLGSPPCLDRFESGRRQGRPRFQGNQTSHRWRPCGAGSSSRAGTCSPSGHGVRLW